MYEKNEPKIPRYKTAFSAEWVTKNVVERQSTGSGALFVIADPKTTTPSLAQPKKDDIKEMLRFMPPGCKAYMSLVVK